jgi:hypothetical protein
MWWSQALWLHFSEWRSGSLPQEQDWPKKGAVDCSGKLVQQPNNLHRLQLAVPGFAKASVQFSESANIFGNTLAF